MPGQWAALVVLSSLVFLALGTAALPAALLLGPMISAIVRSSRMTVCFSAS
jgi:uncharacterized membrane protein AbrB (regulator of aidB expression)